MFEMAMQIPARIVIHAVFYPIVYRRYANIHRVYRIDFTNFFQPHSQHKLQTIPYTLFAMKKQETPKTNKPAVTGIAVSNCSPCIPKRSLTRPEPIMIINGLPWNQHIHTPYACDNIHGQHDGTKDRQFTQHISSLFLALIHANVHLG